VLAIAAGAALLLAPVAALVVDLAGPRRVRGPDDLSAAVSAPVLASIPARWRRRRKRSIRAGGERERTAYRGLRVRVEHLLPPHRTLMVVSPARREGRTSVVANLAHELARSGAKVAVADLDGDKPDLARALAPDSLPVLRPDPDGEGPDTYATSTELLREASQVYDHLVIDTPPLLEADDVLRLASEADGVIMVARCDRTSLPDLEEARELLMIVGAAPAGGVLLGSAR
jgi:Mrp family chromosome partitioning ATPase